MGVLYTALIVGYVGLPIRIPRLVDAVLSKLGEITYSLYLCHAFILAIATRFLIDHFNVTIDTYDKALLVGAFVILPVCVACSFFTYYLIEVPFLRFRRNYLEKISAQPQPVAHTAMP